MSVLNSARYSAWRAARSFSSARSITRCDSVGLKVRDGPCATSVSASPLRAEMLAIGFPQHAALGVGRGGEDQRAAGGGQARRDRVEDLDVGICVAGLGEPERQLVGDDGDVGRAAQLAELMRAAPPG